MKKDIVILYLGITAIVAVISLVAVIVVFNALG